MAARHQHWLEQATRNLEQAAESSASGRHEWACFATQQAAAKAVKALHLYLGQDPQRRAVARLLQDLPEQVSVPADLAERARVLDNFYIPTRYPNSHAEGAPYQHFGPLQSDMALEYAHSIVEFARDAMA